MGHEALIDRRIIGFIFAGGVATLFNYGTFLSLLQVLGSPLLASALGCCAGIGISFLINRLFVFRASKRASFFRYSLSYMLALLFQLALLLLFISLGLSPQAGNAVAIAIVVVLNFFLVRRIVFS